RHHGDRGPAQRHQISRLVPGVHRSAVNPAEATGGEHLDADVGRQVRGGGHGRGTVLTPGGDGGDVALAHLGHRIAVAYAFDSSVVEAETGDPVDNRDGGRNRPALTDGSLDLSGD